MTVSERLRADLDELYIGNLNTVDQDLDLPEKGRRGSCFVWRSGEERFLTGSGKVSRPLYGMGNRKVTFICTARLEEEEAERLFEVTVLQKEKINRIRELLPVKIRYGSLRQGKDEREKTAGEQNNTETEAVIPGLPSVVVALCEDGRYITLPVRWNTGKTRENTEKDPSGRAGKKDGRTFCISGEAEGTCLRARAEIYGDPSGETEHTVCDGQGEKAEPEENQRSGKLGVRFFPLRKVRLSEGSEYFRFRERMDEYLLQTDDGSMLFNFRKAAGLSTEGADPMTGWDAWKCKLRGHTTGHYLSGLALAYAATGDGRFKTKADHMIAELKRCRDAFAEKGTVKEGYFGAFDETQFDLLEKFTPYPEIWAPYYTLEKMMSGLYDVYTLEGNPEALFLLKGLGDWTYERLSGLSDETRKKMWSMYIAGEYGGMIGILAKLSVLTGEEKYLRAAEFFYNDRLFFPMEQNIDVLEDMHANQHIPQVIGAMEMYRASGRAAYYRIGRNFWETVTGHHCYRTGGTGETEMFHGRDCEEAYLTGKTAESCAAYNMLRLTGQLFAFCPDGRYMDYYENTLINSLLAAASKDASGGTAYFLPLGPGARKEYSTDENTCCHGTGMESRYRFAEHIYAENRKNIYVNLYIPSELQGILKLDCPGDGEAVITAECELKKDLCLRIPSWAGKKYVCSACGKEENGYLVIPGPLGKGETVCLRFPMERRIVPVPGSRLKCMAEGPYLLAAVSESGKRRKLDIAVKKAVRLHTLDCEPYHVYFEP